MSNSKKSSIIHKIDSWLWQHGYRMKGIRIALRVLFIINICALALAILTLPINSVALSFALASLLSSLSFFTMARNITRHFPHGGAKKITLKSLMLFFLRMAIIIAISLYAITSLQLHAIAWLAGLGVPILVSPVGFIVRD